MNRKKTKVPHLTFAENPILFIKLAREIGVKSLEVKTSKVG